MSKIKIKIKSMDSFLHRVAQTFYENEKLNFSNIIFVFPNRRAGVFFQNHLSNITENALFAPEIRTINECFELVTKLAPADRIQNIFILYELYKELSNSNENFDSFVFWGDLLLNDFDEVDKFLIDPAQLFHNVSDLSQVGREFTSFTENQLEAIRQFWAHFIPHSHLQTKENFLSTWQILYELYQKFTNQLLSKNFGTSGMISRQIVESMASGTVDLGEKKYVFVGFNALNPCEKKFMLELKKRYQADFYWDYESEFLRDPENPASRFYHENTQLFPSYYNIHVAAFQKPKPTIIATAVPSAVGMAKLTHTILKTIENKNSTQLNWLKTAVILPDEKILLPLLYSIPSTITNINVTMGYPLSLSPVYSLAHSIFELYIHVRQNSEKTLYYHRNISDIIQHQFISQLYPDAVRSITKEMTRMNKFYMSYDELRVNAFFELLFQPVDTTENALNQLLLIFKQLISDWRNLYQTEKITSIEIEFMTQYYMSINRIKGIYLQYIKTIDTDMVTLAKLTQQLVQGVTIPFTGEPLNGLQIMGVLESRGLDFDNLIICSFNEGIYPEKSRQNSFIPYNLRLAFGLPTHEWQNAVNSYNFYRLIDKAKTIYLLYDSRSENAQSAEISRFAKQLTYLYGYQIDSNTINYTISKKNSSIIEIAKNEQILQKLEAFKATAQTKKYLSASSIKTYIECPLQFYLTRIEQYDEKEEVAESIEENMFGTLFHSIMQKIYEPFENKLVIESDIKQLLDNDYNIEKQIAAAFAKEYFKVSVAKNVELDGNNLLVANVLKKYVRKMLAIDLAYCPFTMQKPEERVFYDIKTKFGEVNIKGIIDRTDIKEGKVRILDYKTGLTDKLEFTGWEKVFKHDIENRPKHLLQAFMYALMYKSKHADVKIEPGIIYMRNSFKSEFETGFFDKNLKTIIHDFADYEDEFCQHLTSCIEEIFDPAIPFCQTTKINVCKYCNFNVICNR